jgi:hypothetical protein
MTGLIFAFTVEVNWQFSDVIRVFEAVEIIRAAQASMPPVRGGDPLLSCSQR